MTPGLIHAGWRGLSRWQARPFHRAVRDVAGSQRLGLLRLVRAQAKTDFGIRHGFASMTSPSSFRRRVPLSEFEDYRPDIDRIRNGESNVLTRDPVERFEPTSGTGSLPKLVPYTRGLRQEIVRAVAPWISDLFARYPAIGSGTMYWAISPRIDLPDPGGIPVGFDSDTGYFGGIAGRLAERVLPVPAACASIQDLDTFRYTTLRFLLAREDLRLISVWNPTFLELLLDAAAAWKTELVRDLHDGTLSRDVGTATFSVPAAPARARKVEKALAGEAPPWPRVWPHLAVISCWADGWAAESVPRLRALLPHAALQPKGLLATEAMVTIPVGPSESPVLATASHFYEFLDVDSGDLRLAHELEDDACYEVVVTTGGGLYRYRLHDRVTPRGTFHQAPILAFLGRGDQVSDLRGEKLHASFVQEVLAGLPAADGFLRPHREPGGARYELLLPACPPDPEQLARRLDTRLRANIHYDYCRDLGQLGPPTIRVLEPGECRRGPLSTSKPATLCL